VASWSNYIANLTSFRIRSAHPARAQSETGGSHSLPMKKMAGRGTSGTGGSLVTSYKKIPISAVHILWFSAV
jgi:hypothetical protein